MDKTTYKAHVTAAFDRAAGSYDRLGVTFFTPMGRRLVERVDPKPGERVLDVGCGRGRACSTPRRSSATPATSSASTSHRP